MDERRPLNVNACNLEEVRAVIREADDQIAVVYGEQKKLRTDFDALVEKLGHLGAHPT
jgi:hypothetical protein